MFRAPEGNPHYRRLAGDARGGLNRGWGLTGCPCMGSRGGTGEFMERTGWPAGIRMQGRGREVCDEVVVEVSSVRLPAARVIAVLTRKGCDKAYIHRR